MEPRKDARFGGPAQTGPAKYYHSNDPTAKNFSSLPLGLSTPLEAQWARFFNLLNIKWSPGLPLRFWLPFTYQGEYPQGFPAQRGLWIGVGEFSPSDEMRATCREVAAYSGHWVHYIAGQPQPRIDVWSWRKSERIDLDGQYRVANLEGSWEDPNSYTSFNVDFRAHTVPIGVDVSRVLEMVT